MYIGNTGPEGLHHLVYEVVDNAIDEAMGGYCDEIKVIVHSDNSVTVEDNGRGIPVDLHPGENLPAVEVVMTRLHAGGKFDSGAYKVSGGLHGVGVSVVNALSAYLEVEIRRDGQVYHQRYERGKTATPLTVTGKTKRRGTKVTFLPDGQIFAETNFSYDILAQRLRELSFLNGGVRINLLDELSGRKNEFHYEGGIVSFVEYLNRNKTPIHPDPIYLTGSKGGIQMEIACQYNDTYNEQIFSFANNINTREGGSHLSGFKAGLTRAINQYMGASDLPKNLKNGHLQGEDIREGLIAVISVKLPHPQFEGQTKTKLGNSEVKGLVENMLYEHLLTFHGGKSRGGQAHPHQAPGGGPGPGSGPPRPGPGAQERRFGRHDPAGQAGRLPGTGPGPPGDLPGGGRLRRRLRQAGPGPALPGHPAPEGQDHQRREGPLREDAGELGGSHPDFVPGLRPLPGSRQHG